MLLGYSDSKLTNHTRVRQFNSICVKKGKIGTIIYRSHVPPYHRFSYAGLDNFGHDNLRQITTKHLLTQLGADHSDSVINKVSVILDTYGNDLVRCFDNESALSLLKSRTFKEGDKQVISVKQIFDMMTNIGDMASLMADSPTVIVVSGRHVANVMSILSNEWQYNDVKYRCVMNDDGTIVYEIDDDKVNDD